MKTSFAKFVCCVACASVASIASANNVTTDITADIVGGTAAFGAIHSDSTPFTDRVLIDLPIQLLANVSLITSGGPLHNIDFVSADLNGVPLVFGPTGPVEVGVTDPSAVSLLGPLVLTIHGTTDAGGGTSSAYSGTVNVTQVPEPSAAVLSVLGCLAAAWRLRR